MRYDRARARRLIDGEQPPTGGPSYAAVVVELRTPTEIAAMRPAGRFVADVVTAVAEAADVGVNLLELDALAHHMIRDRGAESCYIDYHPSFGASPFGKVLCTSVNDAVLHGLPCDYLLQGGDLLSVDFAASVDGWVADSAYSLVVGAARPEDLALIATTQRALQAAIAAAQPGNKIGDISHAIGAVAHEAGLRVNTEFGGHGVGRTMHGDPHIPNNGQPGRGYPLKPGLVIAIEPWFLQTTDELVADADGWTLRSMDGSRGAHMEHTVAITESGPLVLTARDREPVVRGGRRAADAPA
jgi:methionyl aminopeptidase